MAYYTSEVCSSCQEACSSECNCWCHGNKGIYDESGPNFQFSWLQAGYFGDGDYDEDEEGLALF